MAADHEIELKFELEGGSRSSLELRRQLEQRFGPGKASRLTSTYFDTPDLALREAAMSLRIRRAGRRRVQTVKAPSNGHGMFSRRQWEQEIEGDSPDLAAASAAPLLSAIGGDAIARLAPAFQSRIERTTWNVGGQDAQIEVALDRGRITAEGASTPVCELEIELKAGEPAALLAFARSIDAIAPLKLGAASKADRGYRLIANASDRAVAGEPPHLHRGMTVVEAFQEAARRSLRHFMLNEPLLAAARNAEALHQCRVALRRLRSALDLFAPVLAPEGLNDLSPRVRQLQRAMGLARDLDVLLGGLGPPADDGAETLASRIRAEREAAYDLAIRALEAPAARRLMLDLAIWVESGPARDDGPCTDLAAFAAEALARRRRKLKKRGRDLQTRSAEERHRARIAAKKLRYAIEPLAGLYEQKRAQRRLQPFLAALKSLQDELGALNDIAAGEAILRHLVTLEAERGGCEGAELAFAAGREAGRRSARAEDHLEKACAAYRRFARTEAFWPREG